MGNLETEGRLCLNGSQRLPLKLTRVIFFVFPSFHHFLHPQSFPLCHLSPTGLWPCFPWHQAHVFSVTSAPICLHHRFDAQASWRPSPSPLSAQVRLPFLLAKLCSIQGQAQLYRGAWGLLLRVVFNPQQGQDVTQSISSPFQWKYWALSPWALTCSSFQGLPGAVVVPLSREASRCCGWATRSMWERGLRDIPWDKAGASIACYLLVVPGEA